MLRRANRTILIACYALAAVSCHQGSYIQQSVSMEPTIKTGDRVKVDRSAYHRSTPARWDIVLFRFPSAADRPLTIMRIVGLPGETIEMTANGMLVNKFPLKLPPDLKVNYRDIESSLIKGKPQYPLVVPENQYFVLGDNVSHSTDSRFWGPLSSNDILGKVIR